MGELAAVLEVEGFVFSFVVGVVVEVLSDVVVGFLFGSKEKVFPVLFISGGLSPKHDLGLLWAPEVTERPSWGAILATWTSSNRGQIKTWRHVLI